MAVGGSASASPPFRVSGVRQWYCHRVSISGVRQWYCHISDSFSARRKLRFSPKQLRPIFGDLMSGAGT